MEDCHIRWWLPVEGFLRPPIWYTKEILHFIVSGCWVIEIQRKFLLSQINSWLTMTLFHTESMMTLKWFEKFLKYQGHQSINVGLIISLNCSCQSDHPNLVEKSIKNMRSCLYAIFEWNVLALKIVKLKGLLKFLIKHNQVLDQYG